MRVDVPCICDFGVEYLVEVAMTLKQVDYVHSSHGNVL